MSQFHISEENPNVGVGGGGTLGSGETHSEDATGPYIIFPNTTTDSNISPHAVLSVNEFEEIADALADRELEQAVDGEPVIDLPEAEVEEVAII